ncbi:MAG: O-antigen ligase family protein [Candidatus Paceibacterota bacterium]
MLKLKLENFYKYFFYLFVFLIPFQSRKVFLTDYSFYTGDFTEYGTIFLYISDVIFLLSIVFLLVFNRGLIKNGLSELKNSSNNRTRLNAAYFIVALTVWFFINTLLNQGVFSISLFRSLKITEMFFLVAFILITFKNRKFLLSSLFTLLMSAYFQSIIAIYQFIYQNSLFSSSLLHKLSGETVLSSDLPGIAKIVSENGERLIRSYGVFPHPNILGGFLVFSIFLSMFLYREHKDSYLSSNAFSGIGKNKRFKKGLISLFWIVIFLSQFLSMFFSFSRSAWIAFFVGVVVFLIFSYKSIRIVSRETIRSVLIKNREILLAFFLFISFIFINSSLLIGRVFQDVSKNEQNNAQNNAQNIYLPENDTFSDRNFFNIVSRETISEKFITGSGPGSAVFQIKPYVDKNYRGVQLESWQIQPTHNFFLLLFSEVGVIGFILFLGIIFYCIKYSFQKIVSRETILEDKFLKVSLISIFVGFVFIGFFDHYFWTIQQGQIIFWMVIGLLLV